MNPSPQIDPVFVESIRALGKLFLGFFTVIGAPSFAFFNLMNEVEGKLELQQAVYNFAILFAWLLLLGSQLFWAMVVVGFVDQALRGLQLSELQWRNVWVPVRLPLQCAVIFCVVLFGWYFLGDASPLFDFLNAFLALDPSNIQNQ